LVFVALLGATAACDPGEVRSAVDLTASDRLTVTHVVDGDTVDLSDERRVRLLGINTPEVDPVECFGPQATDFARTTLQGKPVTATGDPTQDATDQYGRTLAYLTLDDGRDYSTEAAGAGMARARTYGDRPVQRAPQIEAAEQRARAAGLGLWGAGCVQETATATPAPVVVAAEAPRTRTATPKPTPTRRATPAPQPLAQAPAVKPTTAKPAVEKQKPEPTVEKPKPATKLTTKEVAKSAGGCDSNYSGCVPVASDVDCEGGSGNGPAYVSGPVRVIGSDIYGLDADDDGLGCE